MDFSASQFGQKSALHSILAEALSGNRGDNNQLNSSSGNHPQNNPNRKKWNTRGGGGRGSAPTNRGSFPPRQQSPFQSTPSVRAKPESSPFPPYRTSNQLGSSPPNKSAEPTTASAPSNERRWQGSPGPTSSPTLSSPATSPPAAPVAEPPPFTLGPRKADPLVVLRRRLKGNLNKLTIEKFPTITDRIIAISNESIKTFEEVKVLTDLIVDTAMLEEQFSEMYSDLLLVLKNRCPEVPPPGVEDPAKWNPVQAAIYMKLQYEYEHLPEPLEASTTPSGQTVPLTPEEEETKIKLKLRTVGLFVLTGHLFIRGMIGLRLLRTIIVSQLMSTDNPKEDYIECVCKLLLTIGASWEATPNAERLFNQFENRLHDLGQSTGTRLVFLIKDVTEARERGWVKKPNPTQPKRADVQVEGVGTYPVLPTSDIQLGRPSYLLEPDSAYSQYVMQQGNVEFPQSSQQPASPRTAASQQPPTSF